MKTHTRAVCVLQSLLQHGHREESGGENNNLRRLKRSRRVAAVTRVAVDHTLTRVASSHESKSAGARATDNNTTDNQWLPYPTHSALTQRSLGATPVTKYTRELSFPNATLHSCAMVECTSAGKLYCARKLHRNSQAAETQTRD